PSTKRLVDLLRSFDLELLVKSPTGVTANTQSAIMPDNTEKTSNVKTRNMSKSSEDNEPTLQSLDKKLNTIISAIKANSTVIKVIQQEQVDLATSVELCHNNIKDLSESIKKQDARVDMCVSEVGGVKNENTKLKSKVRDLERKLNDLEQYLLRNN
ncbi:hypothetical protein J6590_106718, partial [Homalodisca vitripennis]